MSPEKQAAKTVAEVWLIILGFCALTAGLAHIGIWGLYIAGAMLFVFVSYAIYVDAVEHYKKEEKEKNEVASCN